MPNQFFCYIKIVNLLLNKIYLCCINRLSHVFMLVPNLHWIIVEDANQTSTLVKNLIKRANLENRSTLLASKTPIEFKLKENDPNWKKARGVQQRNEALKWFRNNANKNTHSLVYFMDDDNTYSLELFNEMLLIEHDKVGIWPVGLVGGLMVERPLLDLNTKKVIGFNAMWRPERPFPIDMASFAISSNLLFQRPEAEFSYEVERGYQESEILRHLITIDQLQPLADLCTKVYVWHTRTEKPKLISEEKLLKSGKKPSDDGIEV